VTVETATRRLARTGGPAAGIAGNRKTPALEHLTWYYIELYN